MIYPNMDIDLPENPILTMATARRNSFALDAIQTWTPDPESNSRDPTDQQIIQPMTSDDNSEDDWSDT